MTAIRFERRDPKTLKNHPFSISIYGTQSPDPAFLASLDEYGGVHTPLVILNDGLVIAGHRRRQGAIIKKYDTVPCIVRLDLEDQPFVVERMIVSSNRDTRVRTADVMAREAAALAECESREAALRQKTGLRQGVQIPVGAKAPPRENVGKTRETVAKTMAVGEKKAGALIKVGNAINAAEAAGDMKKAEEIKATVRESLPKAVKLVTPQKPDIKKDVLDEHSKDIERNMLALTGTIARAKKAFADLFNAIDRKKDAHAVFAKERHKKFEKLMRTLFESLDATETHGKSLTILWDDTKKLGMT